MENNIKSIIDKSSKTINAVIEDTGIGKTSFYAIMNGIQVPKITTAKKIADALKMPVHDVFPILRD
ncbi:DNA-binding XRE family transcriptional regulator [Ruminiclostridium sufflavum DSM 19573]|uniref:DNA-binding XRE family transcriptional regulator n=1 Tax=Ruminiclostridium sufflavum DSM 19573 TaxID=1121337 RepID=A0A318XH27_9FIRM|nr:helix-turn-helix transcriptional regulator [Ruminiclostridium sufflavum]PYG84269.1 DNA-binding XRE family transcriptional regulator [Ruminiclostridium sufflavum DSM 19573]